MTGGSALESVWLLVSKATSVMWTWGRSQALRAPTGHTTLPLAGLCLQPQKLVGTLLALEPVFPDR